MLDNKNKRFYSFDEYKEDLDYLTIKIRDILKFTNSPKDVVIVCLYRGSLNLGAYFSNKFDLPLSILKYQTYDGNDDKVQVLYEASTTKNSTLIVLDDIADSYETLMSVYKHYEPKVKEIHSFTLFGKEELNKHFPQNEYLHEADKWVVFEQNGEIL